MSRRPAIALCLCLSSLAAQAPAPRPPLAPPGLPAAPQPSLSPRSPSALAGPFQAFEVFRSHPAIYAGGKRLEILVEELLYPSVASEILAYVELLEQDGWGVAVVRASGGVDTDLRAFLQGRHQTDGIQGAFLIGALPVAWFEMDDDFFLTRSVFPCDLYFMDLDGTWVDQDKDSLWDGHTASSTGDERPELFLGRLAAAPFADALRSETDWVRAYLAKATLWRATRFGLADRALAYQDDPWAQVDTAQGNAFPQVTAVVDPVQTTAAGYLAELALSPRSVVLCAASNDQEHSFQSPGVPPSKVVAADILGSTGWFPFVNLFAARAGDFTATRYIGGAYVLAARGAVSAVASTKNGAMTEWAGYYQALGKRASVGSAFREWLGLRHPYTREQVRWYYGLTLLGDPTLAPRPATLTASLPNLPALGGSVDLGLDAGLTYANKIYMILATANGTSPGAVVSGFRFPLNVDAFTTALIGLANTNIFPNAYGIIDPAGKAVSRFVWNRAIPPEVQGLKLHFAPLILTSTKLLGSTSPASLGLAREVPLAEDFTSTARRDLQRTGAVWGGGKLKPGLLGGSGLLGDFDPAVGSTAVGSGASLVYVFDTGNTMIPADRTLDGKSHWVTDGRYEFATFVVPLGVNVRFEGPHPARIHVRGKAEVFGTLDLSGRPPTVVANYNTNPKESGAPGGAPGAGGGTGGTGGNEPGSGVPQGLPGQDVPVPAGHPRQGQQFGTGGRASIEHPPGLNAGLIALDYYDIASIQASGPGGGGGAHTAGASGSIAMVSPPNWSMKVPAPIPAHGTPAGPSAAMALYPFLAGPQAIDQLLLGGAGGGGVGTCCWGTWSVQPPSVTWSFGNGGGGGGGALALRAGGDLVLGLTGNITTAGGAGGGAGKYPSLAPGGGGAGGTLLLQSAGTATLQGALDASGGPALKSMDLYSTTYFYSAVGGDGFLRVEAPQLPSLANLRSVSPPPAPENTGLLATDRDPITGAASLWHATGLEQAYFTRFAIEALVNGQPMTFSDLANPPGPNQPVAAFALQGAHLDGLGRPMPGSETRWYAITAQLMANQAAFPPGSKANAVRWAIVLDPTVLAAPATLEVTKVSVFHAAP